MSSYCKALATALPVVANILLTASAVQAAPPGQAKARSPQLDCGESVPISAEACRQEFDDWQKSEQKWRKKRQQYGNYVFYQHQAVYEKRPEPPSWIAVYCESRETDSTRRWSAICLAYDDYLRYDWMLHIEGPAQAAGFSTRVQVSFGDSRGFINYLLKNVHYDGPWTNSENGVRSYGVFGTHLTLAHAGRLHFWGPPGVLVLRLPGGQTEVRMTWGIDIFVATIPLGRNFNLPLYVSLAKAFGQGQAAPGDSRVNVGMNMVGLSFTLSR